MSERLALSSAGNILPSALSELRALGYIVSLTDNERLCKAEKDGLVLVAEDPLHLLGLAKLHELRGCDWGPSEAEVEEYLAFDATHQFATERAEVWAADGAVHVLCVGSLGDPVELGEVEAKEFAASLSKAIGEASAE
jgi:hypothetical protein